MWNLNAKLEVIHRTDEDASATAVRQALADDDRCKFAELTSKTALKLFDELKGHIEWQSTSSRQN